jgi:hypothetical protein
MPPTADDRLLSALTTLRPLVARGGEVVLVPSVRARDYACSVRGFTIHAGLASALYCERSGDVASASLNKRPLYVFDGVLLESHLPALVPLLEQLARAAQEPIFAATEIDGPLLHTFVTNAFHKTLPNVVLTARDAGPSGLPLLSRISGAAPGRAGASLVTGNPGLLKDAFATTEVTVVRDASAPTEVGVVYVAGETLEEARVRARAGSAVVLAWLAAP